MAYKFSESTSPTFLNGDAFFVRPFVLFQRCIESK